MEEKTIQVQFGALIRGHLRKMLEGELFAGSPIRWMEDKHWTYSVFSIRGPIDAVDRVGERIRWWKECLDAV